MGGVAGGRAEAVLGAGPAPAPAPARGALIGVGVGPGPRARGRPAPAPGPGVLLGLDDGGDPGGVGLPPHVLRVRELVVFFVLHPPVLEPNFDLSF